MQNPKITSVKINNSLNPMHYIRDEEDIQILINNLITKFPQKDAVTKPVVQLFHICLQFILYKCTVSEWRLDNVNKLLSAITLSEEGNYSPFDIIFEDLAEETDERLRRTYRNYKIFKRCCESDDSIDLKEVAEIVQNLAAPDKGSRLNKHAFSSDSLLKNLKKPTVPLQASIETEDGTHYDLCFWKSYDADIRVEGLTRSNNSISAVVHAVHPFLSNLEKEATLDNAFLAEVLSQCDTKADKHAIRLEWVVQNAFKDDFGDDLNDILEYDPNRNYKLCRKDDTGIHEAGHAVLAWLFDHEVVHATIQKDSAERNGHVTYGAYKTNPSASQKCLIRMLESYAGDLASMDRNQYNYWRSKVSADVVTATDEAKKYVGSHVKTLDHWFIDYTALGVPKTFWVSYKTSLLCEYIYHRTAEIVNANRDLIDTLAAELYKKKTMTGEEIDHVLNTIDPARKGSHLATLPEEEQAINKLLNPYLNKEGEGSNIANEKFASVIRQNHQSCIDRNLYYELRSAWLKAFHEDEKNYQAWYDHLPAEHQTLVDTWEENLLFALVAKRHHEEQLRRYGAEESPLDKIFHSLSE